MAVTIDSAPPHVDSDLEAAWRLAFVVVADGQVATKAVGRALAELRTGGTPVRPAPGRTDLFATTLRLSLSRAAESPEMDSDSAVTTALWQLPAEQRGALWLANVNEFDDLELGKVLGLSAVNAGHIARRAAEWLDVALDHESGPLCQHETQLADFIDGRLPFVEAAEIDAHMSGCPTCQNKVQTFEALSDLKAALGGAVPRAPEDLASEALQQQEAAPAVDGATSMDDRRRPTPGVRPLAACCAGLLILGLVGVKVVRPARHATNPPSSANAGAGASGADTSGAGTSGATGPPASPAARMSGSPGPAVTVTSTTVQPVTFPTIPAGGVKKPGH